MFANPPKDAPDADDPNVIYYKGCEIHDVGLLHVGSNQTVYIENVVLKNVQFYGKKRNECSGRQVFLSSMRGMCDLSKVISWPAFFYP